MDLLIELQRNSYHSVHAKIYARFDGDGIARMPILPDSMHDTFLTQHDTAISKHFKHQQPKHNLGTPFTLDTRSECMEWLNQLLQKSAVGDTKDRSTAKSTRPGLQGSEAHG
jgi:hypothetical protein